LVAFVKLEMKLLLTLLTLFFVSSLCDYAVIKLHTQPDCTGNISGYFVEEGKCYREWSSGPPSFARIRCTPRNLILESDCSKNCTTCFKTTLLQRDQCVTDGRVQYTCEKQIPKLEDTGFYGQFHFNPSCKIEDSEVSLTSFLPRGVCSGSGFQLDGGIFKTNHVEKRGWSYYNGFDAKTNFVKMTRYQEEGCKGRIIDENNYGVGICRSQGSSFNLYLRKFNF
jgi:hypothetical protein